MLEEHKFDEGPPRRLVGCNAQDTPPTDYACVQRKREYVCERYSCDEELPDGTPPSPPDDPTGPSPSPTPTPSDEPPTDPTSSPAPGPTDEEIQQAAA